MSAVRTPARADGLERTGNTEPNRVRRLTTETKTVVQDTELFAYLTGRSRAAGRLTSSSTGG